MVTSQCVVNLSSVDGVFSVWSVDIDFSVRSVNCVFSVWSVDGPFSQCVECGQ